MKKREANKEKKQTAILTAALSVFGEKGYAAAKIIDIARAAGVGKGTIYEYYRSKYDLFFAVFEWYVEQTAGVSMVEASCLGGDAAQIGHKRLENKNISLCETVSGSGLHGMCLAKPHKKRACRLLYLQAL